MITEGTLYRPPLEARTFLLQVTAGCTHNACKFCSMYKDKAFHLIDEEILRANLAEEKSTLETYGRKHERIFLMDGDVFSLSADKIESLINLIREYLPEIETISMYAAVRSIKTKSDEELKRLYDMGINDLYIGYESGLDDVLQYINKGFTLADSFEQAERLNAVGIRHNAMMIIGMAGKGRGEESGKAAVELINRIKPKVVKVESLAVLKGTPLEKEVAEGNFVIPGETEILTEEKSLLAGIEDPEVYFFGSHQSNSVKISGTVGPDREWMLQRLERKIETMDDERFAKMFNRHSISKI